MKVLFVVFELPPLASPGVYRPLGFLRYLEEFGISPCVITTDETSYRQRMAAPLDQSLLSSMMPGVKVERVPCLPPSYVATRISEWKRIFFSLTDEHAAAWRANLIPTAERLVQTERPRALYVTAPPFSMARFGVELGHRLNLPLVLDLRDAWSHWRVSPYATWLHYRMTLRLERNCLAAAARVVTTSPQIRSDLLRLHPRISPSKITTIMNGYDDEVDDWSVSTADGRNDRSATFTITYVGSFYYSPQARDAMMRSRWRKRPNRMFQFTPRKEDWLYRSPYYFLRTVAYMLRHEPRLSRRVRLRFAGTKPDWIEAQVREFGLETITEFLGHVPRAVVLELQKQSDALLLTSSKVIGGMDYSIAGKTFEYLTMKKPIIAFVTDGAQKQLLTDSGMAVICDPDDLDGSACKLRDVVARRTELSPNIPLLKRLSRRALTGELASIFREVANQTDA